MLASQSECANCPMGSYCTRGLRITCGAGTYNPLNNSGDSADCLACPMHSTSLGIGNIDIDDCVCDSAAGFARVPADNGSFVCECAPGFAISDDGTRCEVCAIGTYKEDKGNFGCTSCLTLGAVTTSTASTSRAACVCDTGFYANTSEAPFTCLSCADTHTVSSLRMTNCSAPGVTLRALPLLPGYWRQRSEARVVRQCASNGACAGGANVREQCSTGHTGPLCDVCEDGYHGGRGSACKLCEGSMLLGIAGPICAVLGAVLLVFCILRFKPAALSTVRDVVDSAEDARVADLAEAAWDRIDAYATAAPRKVQFADESGAGGVAAVGHMAVMARHWRQIAHRRQACASLAAKVVAVASTLGVKLRILVSLMQVLSQLEIFFYIRYPRFYGDMLARFSGINLSLGSLPLGCIAPSAASYYGDLLASTLLPTVLVIALATGGHALRRCFRQVKHGPDGKLPLGMVVADFCADLWFIVLFLVYPSVSSAIFNFFNTEYFDGEGEELVTVLRADRSIDVTSPLYKAFFVYALAMTALYPIGVPVLYTLMLYRSRHALREMRRLELLRDADYNLATLKASVAKTEEERREIIHAADAAQAQATAKYEEMREALPSTLRKLTAGYEMRTYWFEIFECLRKLALVSLPIFFEPGSSGQTILGLLICFLAFGMYAHFAPYIHADDDMVAAASQTSIFFALLASLITSAYPDDPIMSTLLPLVAVAPALLTIVFETPIVSEVVKSCGCAASGSADGERTGRCRRLLVYSRDAITEKLDRLLGAADARATQASYRESMRTLQGQHTRRTLLHALARTSGIDDDNGSSAGVSNRADGARDVAPSHASALPLPLPEPAPLPPPGSHALGGEPVSALAAPPTGAETHEGEGEGQEVSSSGLLDWLGTLLSGGRLATADGEPSRRHQGVHPKLISSLSKTSSQMMLRATNLSHKRGGGERTKSRNKDKPPSARPSFGCTEPSGSARPSSASGFAEASITNQRV